MPVITVIMVITFINSMRVFDLIWVMTQGGPFNMSEVIAVLMYKKSLTSMLWGEGSAYGTVLLLITFIPIFFYVRFISRREQ